VLQHIVRRTVTLVAASVPDLYVYRWSALNIDAALLHRFAKRHNWDEGRELLVRCIRHPDCSLATALLVYWLGKPHYYRQYKRRAQVPAHERADFDLLAAIERRVADGTYKHHEITFDPRRFERTDLTAQSYLDLAKQRELPAHMLIAVTKRGAVPFELAGRSRG